MDCAIDRDAFEGFSACAVSFAVAFSFTLLPLLLLAPFV